MCNHIRTNLIYSTVVLVHTGGGVELLESLGPSTTYPKNFPLPPKNFP
jgi:hypothetical protein